MKMCITSSGTDLSAPVDPRFGRCAYLLIVDSETLQTEAIPNQAAGASGGAGIQAAQTIADRGVQVLLTGNIGPNAFRALSASGIEIITGASGSGKNAIEQYKNGELSKTTSPTVGEHAGMGGRGGRGR